jgi:chromosome segregation ATPase
LAICLDYPTKSAEQLEDALRVRRAKVIACFNLQRKIDRHLALAAAIKDITSQHAVQLETVGVEIRDMASRMQEVLGQKANVNEQLIASEKEKKGMKGELEQIKRDLTKERESSSACQMLLRAAGRKRRQAEDEKEAALKELSDMKQDQVGKRKRAIQSWEHSVGAKFE